MKRVYGKVALGNGWTSYELHGTFAAEVADRLRQAVSVLGWDDLLTELEKAVKGKTADEKAYAAYEAVKAISKDDPDLSLSPYSGPVPARGSAQPSVPTGSSSPKTGFACRTCEYFNPDATSNQPDGTYICFNCRC